MFEKKPKKKPKESLGVSNVAQCLNVIYNLLRKKKKNLIVYEMS